MLRKVERRVGADIGCFSWTPPRGARPGRVEKTGGEKIDVCCRWRHLISSHPSALQLQDWQGRICYVWLGVAMVVVVVRGASRNNNEPDINCACCIDIFKLWNLFFFSPSLWRHDLQSQKNEADRCVRVKLQLLACIWPWNHRNSLSGVYWWVSTGSNFREYFIKSLLFVFKFISKLDWL